MKLQIALRLIVRPSAAPPGVVDRLDPAGDGAWILSGAGWAMRVGPAGNARPTSLPPPRAAVLRKLSGADGGAFGVTRTSAPSASSASRLSADIFSGITHTSR